LETTEPNFFVVSQTVERGSRKRLSETRAVFFIKKPQEFRVSKAMDCLAPESS